MGILLIFFLNCSFLDIVEKNQKHVNLNKRVPPFSVYILKGSVREKLKGVSA